MLARCRRSALSDPERSCFPTAFASAWRPRRFRSRAASTARASRPTTGPVGSERAASSRPGSPSISGTATRICSTGRPRSVATPIRFGLEWARVEPEQGQIDETALERYSAIVDACLERGLEPLPTLHHFTHPAWLGEDFWLSQDSPQRFAAWVELVSGATGRSLSALDHLQRDRHLRAALLRIRAAPARAPVRLAGDVRRARAHPRRPRSRLRPDPRAAARRRRPHQLLLCQCLRIRPLPDRPAARPQARRSPRRPRRLDCRAALALVRRHRSRPAHRAQRSGEARPRPLPWAARPVSAGSACVRGAAGRTTPRVRCARPSRPSTRARTSVRSTCSGSTTTTRSPPTTCARPDAAPPAAARVSPTVDLWDDTVYPAGLTEYARANLELSAGAGSAGEPLELWIVENGLCNRVRDGRSYERLDGWDRPRYLRENLAALVAGLDAGLQIGAYLHWSLVDNYEWGSYQPRFGIHGVDRERGVESARRPMPWAATRRAPTGA